MAVPVEAAETTVFIPESLKEPMGDFAPKFIFKSPTERDLRRFRQLVQDDGLEQFDDEEFNAEKLRAIQIYWSPETAQKYTETFTTILLKIKQGLEVTEDEKVWITQLDEELFQVHRELRVMQRKSTEAAEYIPRHALAVYLIGWENLDVAMKRAGGIIPEETVGQITRALSRLGKEHCPVAPSVPMLELLEAAVKAIRLNRDEEKNSPAPSQNSSNPDASGQTPLKDGPSIEENSAASPSSSTSRRKKTPASA